MVKFYLEILTNDECPKGRCELKKKELVEAPLGYWEEKSYMLAIPKDEKYEFSTSAFDRVSAIEGLEFGETNAGVDGIISLKLTYEGEEYEVGLFMGGVSVPEYYLNKNYLFKEDERMTILKANKALTIFMEYKGNAKKCYHLHLKLAVAMVPEMLAVLDESAEKVIPAKWVEMAAASHVAPSSKDLFTVQAIAGKDGKVWLHTHGLCRCNVTELEILESDQENYQNHYNLLCTYAMFLLDREEPFNPRVDGAYIGRLINGYPVVATCRSWTQGIFEYKHLKMGGLDDRKEGHNSKTSIVFLYTSEEDEKNGVLNKVSIYDELWGDNPLFFYSDEETFRMKDLAMERFGYVEKCSKDENNHILIKVGLPLKEEGRFEHIWFELLEVKGGKFKGRLTQEPYDVPDMHTGDEAWYTVDDVTDWIIYTPVMAVSPSNAYLLED